MKINLIGKERNLSWGMEGLVNRALQQLGHEVRFGDIRDEVLEWLPPADLNVFIQGYGLSPDALERLKRRMPVPMVQWHGEVLGAEWPTADLVVQAKVKALIQNVHGYDLVCHNCETSLPLLRSFGAQKVVCVAVSGVDPLVHRRIPEATKQVDLLVYGWASERRLQWVQDVVKYLPEGVTYAWPEPDAGYYGEPLMALINCARVVLNIHYSETLNTETRIYESLGCGTPVVSEPVSMPSLFHEGCGIHYGTTPEAMAEMVQAILGMDQDSYLAFADEGYRLVHERYSYQSRCQQILDAVEKNIR